MLFRWCAVWLSLWLLSSIAFADDAGKAWLDAIVFEDASGEDAIEPLDERGAVGPRVGLRGDPRHIEFEGLEQLTAAQLQAALSRDLVYQAAARTTAPLGTLLATIEKRVGEGMLRSGFVRATVSASFRPDTDDLLVEVHEGERYLKGDVVVHGTDDQIAQKLMAAIQSPIEKRPWQIRTNSATLVDWENHDDCAAAWVPGEVVKADPQSIGSLIACIKYVLVEQGYYHAHVEVECDVDSERSATLVINIPDAGPIATLTQVVVNGLERHSEDAVLDYLGLERGMMLDAEVLNHAHRQLKESCRFWKYRLSVESTTDAGDRYAVHSSQLTLRIDLEEYPFTPPLGEPLSEGEEALKQAALWFEKFSEGDTPEAGDLIVERVGDGDDGDSAYPQFRIVIAPQFGWGARIKDLQSDSFHIAHTLTMASNVLQIVNWERSRGIQLPVRNALLLAWSASDLEDGEYKNSLILKIKGSSNKKRAGKGNSNIAIACDPVSFVNWLYRSGAECQIADGEVRVENNFARIHIEQNSGRIKSFRFVNEDYSDDALQFTFQENAFRDMLDEVESQLGTPQESLNGEIDWEPLVRFLIAEISDQQQFKCDQRFQMARLVIERGIGQKWLETALDLTGFRDLLHLNNRERGSKFNIPAVAENRSSGPLGNLELGIIHGIPGMADTLFPRGSWPWIFSRESALELCEVKSYDLLEGRKAELEMCINAEDKIGLLGDYLAIQTVGRWPDSLVAKLARRAKSKVNEESFAQDIQLLIRGEHGFAKMVQFAVTTLDDLSTEERTLLRDYLDPMYRKPFDALVERREFHPEESPADAVEAVAREWWNDGLEDYLLEELEKFLPEDFAAIPGMNR